MSRPLVYTIDYDSIFRVPPNSTVLHAANETDLTEPDVFTGSKDPGHFYGPYLHHTDEEPTSKDVTGCPDKFVRSDSATSHELLHSKPDELKEVPVTPVAKRSVKNFIKKVFRCA